MARLQRFSGTQSLPGVGSPQVVADTAVGVATQGFGRQIRSSAQDFASLAGTAAQTAQVAQDAKKRQHQIDEAEERNRQKKIRSRVTERSIAERARNRPGGAGYTEDMVAFLEKEHAESLRGLSEEGKTRAEQNFRVDRDRYVSGFATIEAAENEKYFQNGLADDEELLIEEVSRDPAQAAGALKRAETLLRSVPLPARVKDAAFQRIKERVAETWIGARPLDERLGVLEAELGVRGNETADVLSVNGARKDASDNKREDLDPEWSEQLQGLSDATLQRIYMGTLAEKSGASAAEAERIERRIEETHGLFDPREIDANTALTPRQKVQLNDLKTFAREEQSINISALKWLNSDGSAEIEALDRQTLSDRAFAFLDDGKADKGAVVRLIAREKGVLPRPYAASLKKDLESDADDKVKTAYESLGSLADLGISSIAEEPYQQSFRASRVKWHLLRDRFGLSPEEAASRLAHANGGKREKEIRTRFDLDYPQRGSSIALTSRDLLGRISSDVVQAVAKPISGLTIEHGGPTAIKREHAIEGFRLPRTDPASGVRVAQSSVLPDRRARDYPIEAHNLDVLDDSLDNQFPVGPLLGLGLGAWILRNAPESDDQSEEKVEGWIEQKTKPIPHTGGKGRTTGRQFDRNGGGGFEQAKKDFEEMEPADVKSIAEGGLAGTLPDGRKINVRPGSSTDKKTGREGRATIEIQHKNGKRTKIRY